jgi:alcohol dehydrogenase (cytochrome c)
MSWYYQHLPRDYRDLDHPFERMIVETTVVPSADDVPWINPTLKPGDNRKAITGIFGKTGIVWSIDARTGEFLWARPTTF